LQRPQPQSPEDKTIERLPKGQQSLLQLWWEIWTWPSSCLSQKAATTCQCSSDQWFR
jgi:hypothetical protein